MVSITFAEHSIPNPSISCLNKSKVFYYHENAIYQYSIDTKLSIKVADSSIPTFMEILADTHLVVADGNVLKIFDLKNFSSQIKSVRLDYICKKHVVSSNSIAFLHDNKAEIFSLNLKNLIKIDIPESFIDFDCDDDFSYFLSEKGYIVKTRSVFVTRMFIPVQKLVIVPESKDCFTDISLYHNSVILMSNHSVNKYELNEHSIVLQYTLSKNAKDDRLGNSENISQVPAKEKFVLNTKKSTIDAISKTLPSSQYQLTAKISELSISRLESRPTFNPFRTKFVVKQGFLLSDNLVYLSKAPFLVIDEKIYNFCDNMALSESKIYFIKESDQQSINSLTYDTANYSVFVNSKDIKVPEVVKDEKQKGAYVRLAAELEKYKKIAEKVIEIEKSITLRESQIASESEAIKQKVAALDNKKNEIEEKVLRIKKRAESVKFTGDKTGFYLKLESLKERLDTIVPANIKAYKQRLQAIKALLINKIV